MSLLINATHSIQGIDHARQLIKKEFTDLLVIQHLINKAFSQSEGNIVDKCIKRVVQSYVKDH